VTSAALTLADDHLTRTVTGVSGGPQVSAADEVDVCSPPRLTAAIDAALAAGAGELGHRLRADRNPAGARA
jgi:hypothetical protein